MALKENEKMPFLDNLDLKLVSNMKSARKVYTGVVKALAKSSKDKEDVLQAECKLQNLGFVDWLENLSKDDQNLILNGTVQYYIPWRLVWSNSVSTPVRPVFDASMHPPGGCSLNDMTVFKERGYFLFQNLKKKRYFQIRQMWHIIYHVYAEFNEETKSERINAKSLTGNKLCTIY